MKMYKQLNYLGCFKKADGNVLQFIFTGFTKCGINIDPRRIAHSTAIGIWPWMGSLGTHEHGSGNGHGNGNGSENGNGNWSHKCGASLIDDTRVITAAHCVLSRNKVIAE
jgi:hypothetical protein